VLFDTLTPPSRECYSYGGGTRRRLLTLRVIGRSRQTQRLIDRRPWSGVLEGSERMPADPRRVLVVDDDLALTDLLSMVFEDEGYEVRVATGGADALALSEDWRPHVIVLDLMMQDMDGWTFRARQERNHLAHVPVLILTATNTADGRLKDLGAPIVAKPFQLDELLAAVRQVMG
jgi:two-component system response regulator TrcR